MAVYMFLLILLSITHLINSASLRYPIDFVENPSITAENEYSKLQSINNHVNLTKEQKHWKRNITEDDVEIALDKFMRLLNYSIESFSLESTTSHSVIHYETEELSSSVIKHLDDLFSTTSLSPTHETTLKVYSNNNVDTQYLVLQRNFTEFNQEENNQNTMSITIDNVTQDNNNSYTNNSKELVNYQINILSNEIYNQTNDKIEVITPIIVFDPTTMSDNITDANQTSQWGLLFNDHTESIFYNESSTIEINNEFTNNSNEIIINTKNLILNETAILSLQPLNISICDRSCQCLQQCPYGFEILNDTCLCNPPCQNYQCFDNDTCMITDSGRPLCQPENGIERDRPTRCYQPRDAGFHDIHIQYYNRWYYNPLNDTCHLFVYRGLGGNENNFQTLHECHLECKICAPLPDPGECRGRINMWYYDNKRRQCKQFEYSGCKGNENKFLNEEQCINTCIRPIMDLP